MEIADALTKNETLLCLNLYNTGLDAKCSRILREKLEENETLILLDIDGNP
jgi:hypothetical protein